MNTFVTLLIGAVLALGLVWLWSGRMGFRAQSPALYAGGAPAFDLARALDGKLLASGVIHDFRGRVTSRFTATMIGRFDADGGVISEKFVYDNGRTQDREWRITFQGEGRFLALADDIPGQGEGIETGNAVRLRYPLVLPRDVGGHRLDVTDWMYMTADGTIINRSEFRKFGLAVGGLTASFRKVTP